jgi:hypothetical protein
MIESTGRLVFQSQISDETVMRALSFPPGGRDWRPRLQPSLSGGYPESGQSLFIQQRPAANRDMGGPQRHSANSKRLF